jgi:Spy/CpxP family protein refolding chaperone
MKLRTILAAMTMAACLTAGAIDVGAQPRRGRNDMRLGGGFHGLGQLELTETQREQIREINQRHRDELREAGTRARSARQAQTEAESILPVNETLVRQRAQEYGNALAEIAVIQARIRGEIFQILTPEQQKKAQEVEKQRQERMKGRPRR